MIFRWSLLVAMGFALLLSGTPARGQSEPAVARELARLVFTSATFDGSLALAGTLGSQVLRVNVENRVGRQLTEHEASRLDGLSARLTREIIPQHEWETLFAGQLARRFSADEMQALVAFYRTPLGAKARQVSDILVGDAAMIANRLMKPREGEFHQRFAAALERELPALTHEIRQWRRVPAPPATTF